VPGGPSILPLEAPLRHGEDLGCSIGKMPGNDRTLPRADARIVDPMEISLDGEVEIEMHMRGCYNRRR